MIKSMTRATRKAFTLIELIVVFVILGILALIAIPKFLQIENLAHFASVATTAQSVEDEAVALGAFTQTADSGIYSGTTTNVMQAAQDLGNLDKAAVLGATATSANQGNVVSVLAASATSANYVVTNGAGFSVCLVPSGIVGVTGVTYNENGTGLQSTSDIPTATAASECAASTSTTFN